MREPWQLRAAFARRLSELYGREVPAYLTLVEVTNQVNAEVLATDGPAVHRLGGGARVTVERHGAIRLGSALELSQAARLFTALGMHPVGFYDLRDSGVPVVSTAFRPLDAEELERNPFRVFTSVLTSQDERFFDAGFGARIQRRLSSRQLFSPELLALADVCSAGAGLPDDDAEQFLWLLSEAFQLDSTPIDKSWYDELHAVSAVAADIAGCATTHLNHLTPRVLDIDALQARMQSRGIEMIPEIQGPPAWDGPDVLLRQTSFKALAEDRRFCGQDGTILNGRLRVRFGEVEARGIALTERGHALYEEAVAGRPWQDAFPLTEQELFLDGLGVFTAAIVPGRADDGRVPQGSLASLADDGFVRLEPVLYEDFLPRSAAGIFRSNLDRDTPVCEADTGTKYDQAWLAAALDCELHDPHQLYADATGRSLRGIAARLDLPHGALDLRSTACS